MTTNLKRRALHCIATTHCWPCLSILFVCTTLYELNSLEEASRSCLSVTVSMTFVYPVSSTFSFTTNNVLSIELPKPLSLKRARYTIVVGSAQGLELSHHKKATTEFDDSCTETLSSNDSFWCAPECSCWVHTDPSEPHSWPKPLWVDLNRCSVYGVVCMFSLRIRSVSPGTLTSSKAHI